MKTSQRMYSLVLLIHGTLAFTGYNSFGLSRGVKTTYQQSESHRQQQSVRSLLVFGTKQNEHFPEMEDWHIETFHLEDDTINRQRRFSGYQVAAEETQKTIDTSDESTKLYSLGNSAIIMALTTSSSLQNMMNLEVSDANIVSFLIGNLALITSALSSLLGIYSIINTINFNENPIGTEKYSLQDNSMKVNEARQNCGQKAFQRSLLLFVCEIVFMAVSKVQVTLQLPCLAVAVLAALTVLSLKDLGTFSDRAASFFTNEITRNENDDDALSRDDPSVDRNSEMNKSSESFGAFQ